MSQEPVWKYFQNEGKDVFSGAHRRLEYLSKRVLAEESVLNIGVGNGLLEEMLTAKGISVSVLDPDEGAIKRLREKLNLGDRAQNGYARSIPFVAHSFDVVIMSEVLEHLDDRELVDSLGEVQRVLRPGGRFIGTVPARENLSAAMVVCPHCAERFHRWGHRQAFDREKLHSVLSQHFVVMVLKERAFMPWKILNWKGKVIGSVKYLLSRMGVHGSEENLVFEAMKLCV